MLVFLSGVLVESAQGSHFVLSSGPDGLSVIDKNAIIPVTIFVLRFACNITVRLFPPRLGYLGYFEEVILRFARHRYSALGGENVSTAIVSTGKYALCCTPPGMP